MQTSPQPTRAFAVQSPDSPFAPITIDRRAPGPRDVAIDILYCGICHSDIHQARGEWANTRYPCVPGHEIAGRVTAVGGEVTRVRPGDLVGVGCMVDSCRTCEPCGEGLEQYCEGPHGALLTYNGYGDGSGDNTFGGYSAAITVDEHFVLKVSHAETDLAGVAPLLCAGVTTWSPLRHWGVGPGKKVGVVGIGGLGHMGVKLARAMGAHVVAFTTSPSKRQDALDLGAHEVVLSTDKEEMNAHRRSLHFVLNTVAAPHDLDPFIALLRHDGTMTLVGAPSTPHPSPNFMALIGARRAVAGSVIGGIAETQEMLDFCAQHGITSDIEMVPAQAIDQAYERVARNDVKYRFVIDMASLKDGLDAAA